jgi:hypothetical protein
LKIPTLCGVAIAIACGKLCDNHLENGAIIGIVSEPFN